MFFSFFFLKLVQPTGPCLYQWDWEHEAFFLQTWIMFPKVPFIEFECFFFNYFFILINHLQSFHLDLILFFEKINNK